MPADPPAANVAESGLTDKAANQSAGAGTQSSGDTASGVSTETRWANPIYLGNVRLQGFPKAYSLKDLALAPAVHILC